MHVENYIYARNSATTMVFLLDSSGLWEKDVSEVAVGETPSSADGARASLLVRDHPSTE